MTEKRDEATLKIRESTSPSYQVKVMENIPSNAISQDKKPLMWWEKEIYRHVSPVDRQNIIMKTWNKEIFSRNLGKLFGEEIIDTLYCSPSRYITELRDNASRWDLRQQLLHLGDCYYYNADEGKYYIRKDKSAKNSLSSEFATVHVAHTQEFDELCDEVQKVAFAYFQHNMLQRLRAKNELQRIQNGLSSEDEIVRSANEKARYYATRQTRSFANSTSSNILFIVTAEALNIFYSSSSNNNYGLYPRKLIKVDNPLFMVRTGRYSVYRHPIEDCRPNKATLSPYRNPITLQKAFGELLKDKGQILYNFNEFEYLF